jgi:hypothetical protein
MVDLVDFDFHHSFLIISTLFAASILAILYLSHLFALALLVYREHVTPNARRGMLMAALNWARAHGLEDEGIWFANATVG